MAAKKMTAKQKQTSDGGRTAARKGTATSRSDVALRSGMGETASSNIGRRIRGSGSATPAQMTAINAAKKTVKRGESYTTTKAFKGSMAAAQKYASSKKKKK